jgi:hypothetical protein
VQDHRAKRRIHFSEDNPARKPILGHKKRTCIGHKPGHLRDCFLSGALDLPTRSLFACASEGFAKALRSVSPLPPGCGKRTVSGMSEMNSRQVEVSERHIEIEGISTQLFVRDSLAAHLRIDASSSLPECWRIRADSEMA